jgi:glutamyl-tRNA synthetase
VTVRVRFAPSPTGHLHIGGARTAIYNWAFARRDGGSFILRIDDTDPERSTEENVQAILRGLKWLGVDWDEGPEVGGGFGPYFQTERAASYVRALEHMRANDSAYPCFCSAQDLERKRDAARASSAQAGYDRTCRALSREAAEARIAAGETPVWRLKVPEGRGDIAFTDAVRGEMSFAASDMDDYVLVRSDGTPTYNFATVVDDAEMEITHVIRGDDHLSNTPRQILVFEALGHAVPTFAHLSMIWGPDGKRLSKRHGATSVEAYRDMGFLPQALMNYLALLGWSLDGDTTVIDASMLTSNFSLDRISKNPAIFDAEKLEWLNGVYLREMPAEEFVATMVPWLEAAGWLNAEEAVTRHHWLLQLAPLVSERIKRMDELAPAVSFLFVPPEIAAEAREKVILQEGAGRALDAAVEALTAVQPFEHDAIEGALRALPERLGMKPKQVFQVVRVAATGSMVSPPLFESLALLGRAECLERLHRVRPLAAE